MTRLVEWGSVTAPDGGVMGVHSLSDETPIKSANFDFANRAFEGATKYADWVFNYSPQDIMQNQPGK